ncbi:SDR family oxidoreductase [Photobacterium leiognathi]|uniref:SDR family oxidoreductase n=1 Tax=Photobacterium leiognathi TaxID=553611 RepID=UPI0029829E49|nr:SDR family oxidoreductase [Photobacterium leiognathi]
MDSSSNKVVIVTGGANGIGKGICKYLTQKNMTVIALDINEQAGFDLVNEEPRIRFRLADVTKISDIKSTLDWITTQFGRLDGLVNNAAIANPYNTPLQQLPLDEWHRILNVNLTSPLVMSQQCLPLLTESKGHIINMSSTRYLQSEANTEAYAASKGGIVSLTHALSVSLSPNIKVNCISPGWIHNDNSELREIDHQQHLSGRVGNVDDIAEMVAFLLDSQGFITGQNFVIDGGMTKKMIYSE